VVLVGLTGGIGSGKSTVLGMLAERGAVTLDADDLARRAVAPGTAGLVRVLDRFGPGVRAPDGSLDRQALADLVFADPEARRDLEAITHPEVARLFADAVAPHRDTSSVVVYAVPLLLERGLRGAFDVVVTISAGEGVRTERAVGDRGRAQATEAEGEAVADVVIRNDRWLDELAGEVDRLWEDLRART